MKINYFKNEKMKLFTKEQQESYENAKICYICRKNLKINILRTKNIIKLDITVTAKGNYRSAAHTRITSKCSVPKIIPIAFCNGSNYDDHFIIKELAEQFKSNSLIQEKTLENTVPIKKDVTRINKNGEEDAKHDPTYYNLLIVKDLQQARYQILSIILLKELIKLELNTGTITKNLKLSDLSVSIATAF